MGLITTKKLDNVCSSCVQHASCIIGRKPRAEIHFKITNQSTRNTEERFFHSIFLIFRLLWGIIHVIGSPPFEQFRSVHPYFFPLDTLANVSDNQSSPW